LAVAAAVSLVVATSAAVAQQGPSGGNPAGGFPTTGANTPAKPATPKTPAKPKTETAPAASSSDTGLRQRIEGLEEQFVDMQVQLGTLESLAKSSGAASASPAYRAGAAETGGGSPVDAGRLSGLENQVRTLTQQVQQLTDQVRTLGGNPGRPMRDGNLAPSAAPLPPLPSSASTTIATAPAGSTPPGWTVSPQAAARDGALAGPADVAGATLPPIPAATGPTGGADPAGAKAAYEAAYQSLLQQDYGAAEVAFDDFIKRYPSDSLAGNAQFWLGETHFVRGQYKPAASAFLKGYRSYGRSSKAPDSLLKLAMSLGRLGQRDEACSALGELASKYPAATNDVKSRTVAERQRNGCP